MTKKELLEYYRENKNICNEIELVGKNTGIVKIFRKYIEVFTGEDKWLAIKEGVIFNNVDILVSYKIPSPFNIFHSLEIGDIIRILRVCGGVEFYKKIDEDAFIQCEKNGYIDTDMCLFLYNSEDIIDMSESYEKYEE